MGGPTVREISVFCTSNTSAKLLASYYASSGCTFQPHNYYYFFFFSAKGTIYFPLESRNRIIPLCIISLTGRDRARERRERLKWRTTWKWPRSRRKPATELLWYSSLAHRIFSIIFLLIVHLDYSKP